MKNRTISFMLTFIPSIAFAQTDSLPQSFFPAHLGDVWNYQGGADTSQKLATRLTRDSITSGERYLFFDSSNIPAFEMDSSLNVFSDPTTGYRSLQYKLSASLGETWTVRDVTVARVDAVSWNLVLGRITQVKKIGYYSGLDTTFNTWFYDRYLAAGFGFYLAIADASQTPDVELVGCTIDGITYGDVMSVKNGPVTVMPGGYALSLPYPNPFNPSTSLQYTLPHNGRVTISVFSILGVKTFDIFDSFQEAGTHYVSFRPQNLPSGLYFVRMMADGFASTRKIIYSK